MGWLPLRPHDLVIGLVFILVSGVVGAVSRPSLDDSEVVQDDSPDAPEPPSAASPPPPEVVRAFVTGRLVPVYSVPGGNGTPSAQLRAGAVVEHVESARMGWQRIRSHGVDIGYIDAAHLATLDRNDRGHFQWGNAMDIARKGSHNERRPALRRAHVYGDLAMVMKVGSVEQGEMLTIVNRFTNGINRFTNGILISASANGGLVGYMRSSQVASARSTGPAARATGATADGKDLE